MSSEFFFMLIGRLQDMKHWYTTDKQTTDMPKHTQKVVIENVQAKVTK
jgi:hypothetical protein